MEQAQILFPEPAFTPEPSRVIPFEPRQSRTGRRAGDRARLSGDGLAQRLRRDVERQIAHRRRMLAHLQQTSAVAVGASDRRE